MSFPQTIAVTGASGLVGYSLCESLRGVGSQVRRLVRRRPEVGSDDIYWDPAKGEIDRDALEGIDAVVHLAGENIANQRWSDKKKQAIARSRIEGTRIIAEAVAGLNHRPRVLVSASAIGFYGDRGPHPVDENSPPGAGFLAETCVAWEAESRPAWEAGVRVVQVRIGVVISRRGGALVKMLTPFKLGLGGVLGDGRQYVSWIAMEDLVNIFHHCLANDGVHGAVNGTAPHAVTNREFTRTLGRLLGRPTMLPVPRLALRATVGGFADEALLASANVRPTRLEQSGFGFLYPQIEGALRREMAV